MRTNRETPLCRYHYDALDRLAVCTPAEQASTGRFYQENRLATEIQDWVQHSIFQSDNQLLAQRQRQGGTVATTLLITDQQRSVLNALEATPPRSRAYTPYGHRPVGNGLLSLLGFNGERPDPVTGHYHLGNGYRQFNPVLMRFNSPDSWSPFGKGGINAYAYCAGDPINRADPTGHVLDALVKTLQSKAKLTPSGSQFISDLKKMDKALGGSEAVMKAANSKKKVTPESYLFNKTVNKHLSDKLADINTYQNQIAKAANANIVMDASSNISVEVERYFRFKEWVSTYDLVNNKAWARMQSMSTDILAVESKSKQMGIDRIVALANIASASPKPTDAVRNIRK
ncbi:RHS repeat-associated core domain-containing protein [Pseudomonas sp. SbOxS1]|uniref:RHS repeat-associated core domain-containing protein n=1 Tax=Pseudomonas sp. SbOxS1 TaxID=2723884 RepID=UPI0015D1784C|nr:RHS repeat-associated core domain-containing protein [Pseudomonas sp. SbOxS1]